MIYETLFERLFNFYVHENMNLTDGQKPDKAYEKFIDSRSSSELRKNFIEYFEHLTCTLLTDKYFMDKVFNSHYLFDSLVSNFLAVKKLNLGEDNTINVGCDLLTYWYIKCNDLPIIMDKELHKWLISEEMQNTVADAVIKEYKLINKSLH